MEKKRIASRLVLSTGRCGSAMVSDVLNTHPEVLSLARACAPGLETLGYEA